VPRSVVWLASYPKSGNTWLRFLVCNLVFGPQDSAAALNQLAPDIHELGPNLAVPATPVLMKTHFAFGPSLPLAAHTAAAIYVVRHPADVLVSNFHYAQRSGSAAPDPAGFDRFASEFLAKGGDPRWIRLGIGRWDENVRSWLAPGHPFPVLKLRYEDLLAEPHAGAQRICEFLGLDKTPPEVERAVAGASFERMRSIEESDIRSKKVGVFFKPYLQSTIDSGLRFMRSGKAGEGARRLSDEQRRAVTAGFGPLMAELGYS
jgi:hypothetical protein